MNSAYQWLDSLGISDMSALDRDNAELQAAWAYHLQLACQPGAHCVMVFTQRSLSE